MVSEVKNLEIFKVESSKHLKLVKVLFLEYARSLNFDLCFQNFDKEVAGLPGEYASPDGVLLLAIVEQENAGYVALRKIDNSTCEMKRLYVRPEYRGKGLGKQLSVEVINEARKIGYTLMKLDTIPSMKEAIKLYETLGFKRTASYRFNPVAGAIYMELNLKNLQGGFV